MEDLRIERVLRAVECVPAGFMATYGDIGAVTGDSPRIVGNLMSRWGSNVPWWRICNAKGEISGHFEQALPHWSTEGITLNSQRTGVVLRHHRIDLTPLRSEWERRVQDLR